MEDSVKDGLASFSLFTVSFTVNNLMHSINWYQCVFGFKIISRNSFKTSTGWNDVAIIEAGGLRLEFSNLPRENCIETRIANGPLPLVASGGKSIVLKVNDIALAGMELEKKGVEFVWTEQLFSENDVLCITIKDIDGNIINIFQSAAILNK